MTTWLSEGTATGSSVGWGVAAAEEAAPPGASDGSEVTSAEEADVADDAEDTAVELTAS